MVTSLIPRAGGQYSSDLHLLRFAAIGARTLNNETDREPISRIGTSADDWRGV
jgi:hypothetical protein